MADTGKRQLRWKCVARSRWRRVSVSTLTARSLLNAIGCGTVPVSIVVPDFDMCEYVAPIPTRSRTWTNPPRSPNAPVPTVLVAVKRASSPYARC